MAAAAAFVAAGILCAGCDGANVVGPGQFTVTLSTASQVLAAGARADVNAVVSDRTGTRVADGTSVIFTTTLGRVEPAEVTTRNGIASTTFLAGDVAGLAEVHAAAGDARATAVFSVTPPATTTGTVTGSLSAADLGAGNIRANAYVQGATVAQYEWIFEGTQPSLITTSNEGWYTYSTPGHKDFSVRVVLTDGRTIILTAAIYL